MENVTVVPGLGVIAIMAEHTAAGPSLTNSDVIRWIGVAIAVAGIILATPGGIASAWHSTKRWNRKMRALGRRLLRRPQQITGSVGAILARLNLSGSAFAHKWQRWLPRAGPDLKIDILHQQVEILLEEIGKLHAKVDQIGRDLRKEIQEAEERVMGQVRRVESEFHGERTRASRVDARGLGPIACGIILTGLPDELAGVAPDGWLGWLVVAVGTLWVIRVTPNWLGDYKQALEDTKDC